MAGRFPGGKHTEEKLEVVSSYLRAYTTALRKRFELWYIDGFAGSGDYSLEIADAGLFAEEGGGEGLVTRPGSARLALAVDPPFERFLFIDKKRASVEALEAIRRQNPDRASAIEIKRGDANELVRDTCRTISRRRRDVRAVLFLDPFALSVDWETLVEVGKTKAIDLWYLFPTENIGRLLAGDQTAIAENWEPRLNSVLGGDWWRREFYQEPPRQGSLFEPEPKVENVRVAKDRDIEQAFLKRLAEHMAYVAPNPRRLYRKNRHAFSLIFAVSNPSKNAIALARQVSDHLLSKPLAIKRP